MKIIEKQLHNIIFYPISDKFTPSSVIYFDIETTGLSADTTYLYMIGILIEKDNVPTVIQWLADDISEEKEIIMYFFDMLCNYKLLVHYNGQAFDIPYLLKKIKKYHLKYSFQNIETIDIYREIKPLKKIFSFINLKQKTIEEYLDFYRQDLFSGEQLIELYSQYTGFTRYEKLRPDILHYKAKALRFSLLLHNEEDLIGLSRICYLLYYIDIMKGSFSLENVDIHCINTYGQEEYTDLCKEKKYIQFRLSPYIELPKEKFLYLQKRPFTFSLPFNYPADENEFMLFFDAGKVFINITYYERELKYFFDDYKDYYYLPEEDTALHKSVGEYVDKAYRQKAKKTNCYQRKSGFFLPQPLPIFSPAFKYMYKDKYTFFELADNVFTDLNLVKDYVISILNVYS